MSGSTSGFPIVNFPAVGPIGGYYNLGAGGGVAQILADNEMWMGGPLLYTILAELRVQTQLLATIANVPDNLSQLRADAVADMGTLYATGPVAPTPSS